MEKIHKKGGLFLYTTDNPFEYEFLQRQHIPLVKHEAGLFYFKKTSALFLELYRFFSRVEQQIDYEDMVRQIDAIL